MNTNNLNRTIDLPEPIAGCFFRANWVAPKNVKTLISTRNGGVSQPPFASLNVGAHVGDNRAAVAQNRAILQQHVPVPMVYRNQPNRTMWCRLLCVWARLLMTMRLGTIQGAWRVP